MSDPLIAYDIECYDNFFLLNWESVFGTKKGSFEISVDKNEWMELRRFIKTCNNNNIYLVGWNNKSYDYPVLHELLTIAPPETMMYEYQYLTSIARKKSNEIFATKWGDAWRNFVPDNETIVKQLDLFQMGHYNNEAKILSLKGAEVYLEMDNIENIPFTGEVLPYNLHEPTRPYCAHDVLATKLMMLDPIHMEGWNLRKDMEELLGYPVHNFNEPKLGQAIMAKELREMARAKAKQQGIKYVDPLYEYIDGEKKPRQTKRSEIPLTDVIFDFVKFKSPAFNALHDYMDNMILRSTKKAFNDIPIEFSRDLISHTPLTNIIASRLGSLVVQHEGLDYSFGTGGIHASISNTSVYEDDDYMILDIDVTSYYPSIGIEHNLYPEHLGHDFVIAYSGLKQKRLSYDAGTSLNKAFKLALNALYGVTNSIFSPYYDPKYTMTVTINGQLMLAMLVDSLTDKIDGLSVIQANTDGITIRFPRLDEQDVTAIVNEWEDTTKMKMEYAHYSSMHIRDVNNYIAQHVDPNKPPKVKGAYLFEKILPEKNQDYKIVKKAVHDYIVNGTPVIDTISACDNLHKFTLSVKGSEKVAVITSSIMKPEPTVKKPTATVKRDNPDLYDLLMEEYKLHLKDIIDQFLADVNVHGKVFRFCAVTKGDNLYRVYNPLENAYHQRVNGVHMDCKVKPADDISNISFDDLDYDYYINKAKDMIRDLGVDVE